MAVINFTCEMDKVAPIDSVSFVSGRIRMSGKVKKVHISAEQQRWKHRYAFTTGVKGLYTFFDVNATPQVAVYRQSDIYIYPVKSASWRSTAPMLHQIFEMIRINEQH